MQRDDQTANADMLVYSESRNLREGFGVNNHFRRVSTQSTFHPRDYFSRN